MRKKLRALSLSALFVMGVGCAHQEEKPKVKNFCQENSLEANHVSIATRSLSSRFNNCFLNYLNLRELKEASASVCAYLHILPNGSVSDAVVIGKGKDFPNDLKWCLEQELWKMDYSKLQFERALKVQFPLNFEARRE